MEVEESEQYMFIFIRLCWRSRENEGKAFSVKHITGYCYIWTFSFSGKDVSEIHTETASAHILPEVQFVFRYRDSWHSIYALKSQRAEAESGAELVWQ